MLIWADLALAPRGRKRLAATSQGPFLFSSIVPEICEAE